MLPAVAQLAPPVQARPLATVAVLLDGAGPEILTVVRDVNRALEPAESMFLRAVPPSVRLLRLLQQQYQLMQAAAVLQDTPAKDRHLATAAGELEETA